MKDFLVLFREDDGRTIEHQEEETERHQLHWKNWLERNAKQGKLAGGRPLTLRGNVIRNSNSVSSGPYQVGTEIVGGYLLIKADSLEEATDLVKSCPVFEFDGFAEVREMM